MPELPEVESVRRGLAEAKIRAPVLAIYRSRKKLRMSTSLRPLLGAFPGEVCRRGKYIIWEFSRPKPKEGQRIATDAAEQENCTEGPLGLLLHLGMSGRCGITCAQQSRVPHTHMILTFEDGRELRFVDARRFGGFRVASLAEILGPPPIAALGPEPIDPGFSGRVLAARLGQSKRGLRDALLDQRAVAGVGNIYAIEALFEAGIHPLTAAFKLRDSAWDRLARALAGVLQRGIANGGTTLKDFRNVVGEVGRNQDDLRVYGRSGQPCPACGRPLKSFTSSGRSGVFCPYDQSAQRVH